MNHVCLERYPEIRTNVDLVALGDMCRHRAMQWVCIRIVESNGDLYAFALGY